MLSSIVYALLAAALYAPLALSWAVVYRVAGFFHFTHAAVFAAGAYGALAAHQLAGLPLLPSLLLGVIVAAVIGFLAEYLVYRPLRRRGASAETLLLASLGAYIVLENFIVLLFGVAPRRLQSADPASADLVLGVALTTVQRFIILGSFASCVAAWLLLTRTHVGLMVRAFANDPELARAVGINRERLMVITFIVGSAFGGFVGVLAALDTAITPTIALPVLMIAVVAAIAGGVDSFAGNILGALLIAGMEKVATIFLSTRWQDTVSFLILITFLLVRPHGLLGQRLRKAMA